MDDAVRRRDRRELLVRDARRSRRAAGRCPRGGRAVAGGPVPRPYLRRERRGTAPARGWATRTGRPGRGAGEALGLLRDDHGRPRAVVLALGGLLSRLLLPSVGYWRRGAATPCRASPPGSSSARWRSPPWVRRSASPEGSQLIGLFFRIGVRTAPMARGDRSRRRAHRDRRDGPEPAAGGRRSRAPAPDPVAGGLLAGSLVLLIADGTPTQRVAAGFISGEVVALAALLVAARWRDRRGSRVDPGGRVGPEHA